VLKPKQRRNSVMKLLYTGLALLLIVSVASAYEWEVVELGGLDSDQPYHGGEVHFLDNGFTMTAEGGEIWNAKLGCTVALIKGGLSGDFTIEYTITEHTNEPPHDWSKFGVILLKELDPNSAYVYVQASLASNRPSKDYGARIIGRSQPGINVDFNAGGIGWKPLEWPMTHKLVREGDVFTASISLDGGKTYQSLDDGAGSPDNVEFALDDPVIVGFALCAKGGPGVATATAVDILINGQDVMVVQPAGKLLTTWAELRLTE
jgi:hypothetical protein